MSFAATDFVYSAILALTLQVGQCVVSVSQITLSTLEDRLREDAKRLIYSREFRLDRLGYDSRRIAVPDTYIQTIDPTGTIMARTTNLGDFQLPIDGDDLQAASSGKSWTAMATTDNGRLFVFNQPVVLRGQLLGVMQLARSLAEQDESLETLRNALLMGSVCRGWRSSSAGSCPARRCVPFSASPIPRRSSARSAISIGAWTIAARPTKWANSPRPSTAC
jgi:hypothetical protein